MATISTHVLDLSLGKPGQGIPVALERGGTVLARASTDADGRVRSFVPQDAGLSPGTYRMVYSVGEYFKSRKMGSIYADIVVQFEVSSDSERYHIPLLLGPYGYSTYRGS